MSDEKDNRAYGDIFRGEAEASYSDRFDLSYSIYGKSLDVDALLSKARPSRAARVWHSGERRGATRTSKTAGVRCDIAQCHTADEVLSALREFLVAERRFLESAASYKTPGTQSVLTCVMWVYAVVPSTVALPPDAMRALADLDIEWVTTGYPCGDLAGP
jgi:hypothetical protein